MHPPHQGPVLEYLDALPEADRTAIVMTLRRFLSQGEGDMLLELLDKSVNARMVSLTQDTRAFEYAMAWRYLVSDLQLIARTSDAYQSPLARGSSQARR